MVPDDEELIINDIKKNNPDLIAFTCTSLEYCRTNEIAGAIKKAIDLPVILGGVHASVSPQDFEESNFDAFVLGEGENTIISIANGETKPEGIIIGKTVEDLDTLPFHDWDIIDSKKIIDNKNGWVDVGFSRDCPFNCAFCSNKLLRKIKGIKKVRKRSKEKVIEELKYIHSRFNVKVFNFADDDFTLNRKWLYDFLTTYKKEFLDKYNIKYVIQSRVDTFIEETAKRLKESGCIEVQFGVETGNQELRDFLDKGVTNKQIEDAFERCHKYDINTYAYVIFGIPNEKEEDVNLTMKFLSEIKPNIIRPTFLIPLRGTKVHDYCVEHDIIKKNVTAWNFESPLKIDSIDEETLLKYWLLFPWIVNYKLGYEEYKEGIDEFFTLKYDDLRKPETFNQLLEKDEGYSRMMKERNLDHYIYKEEKFKGEQRAFRLNRLQLVKGS
jgi:magnesium-protoporphyrin IX monomethyl ester (oxidative) cyclase